MELVYLYIGDCARLGKDKEIQFSGEFNINKKVDLINRTIDIEITKNKDYLINYFLPIISNITAIVGQNGAGKTTLTDFLINFFNDYPGYGNQWLAVFKDKENKLHASHTLYSYKTNEEDKIEHYDEWITKINIGLEELEVKKIDTYSFEKYQLSMKELSEVSNTHLIYYSGFLDLNEKIYGGKYRKEITNISTNFLINHDSSNEDDYVKDKPKLLIHKHANIERQIKLTELNSQLMPEIINLPTEIKLVFDTIRVDVEKSRELNAKSKKIYGFLKDKINDEYDAVNKQLSILTNESGKELFKEKTRLRFFDSFINYFFSNIDTGDLWMADPGFVFTEDNEILTSREAIVYFLEKNVFLVNKEPNKALFTIINDVFDAENSYTFDDSSELIIKDKTNIIEIMSWEERSFMVWPFLNNVVSFLSYDWRDMSSGEKALLDIYSRLLVAKNSIVKNREKNNYTANSPALPYEHLYLIIDEGELGFHPEWQRKFIDQLETFVNYLFVNTEPVFSGCKVQIILTSHSPFIISDLPKSNVVFLKKEEDSFFNTVNSSSREETFGSNIHLLLSDSFFFQEGNLIGEKVRKKLYEVIDLLTNKKLKGKASEHKTEILNFINTIGEPIIKERLTSMYNKCFDIETIDIESHIQSLRDEILYYEQLKSEGDDKSK